MSLLLWILLALPTPSPGATSMRGRCPAPARAPLPGAAAALAPQAGRARRETICSPSPPIHPAGLRRSSVEYSAVFALLAPCPAGASAAILDRLVSRRALTCRYECICFRTTGYRCLRTYTERCDGRACWQCQDRVTRKARRSCSIGAPIRSCFCKYQQRPGRGPKAGSAPAKSWPLGQSRSARSISAS